MRVWNASVGPAEVEAPAEPRQRKVPVRCCGGRKQPLRAGGVFVGQGRRSELGPRRMDRAASDNVDAHDHRRPAVPDRMGPVRWTVWNWPGDWRRAARISTRG